MYITNCLGRVSNPHCLFADGVYASFQTPHNPPPHHFSLFRLLYALTFTGVVDVLSGAVQQSRRSPNPRVYHKRPLNPHCRPPLQVAAKMGNTITKESVLIDNADQCDVQGNRIRRHSHSRGDRATGPPRKHGRSHHGKSHRKREGYEMIIDPNETVDGGYLFPQGVYEGAQDYKIATVRDAIIKRKLAPFYKGLDSVEPTWTDRELYEHVKGPEPKTPPKPGQPGPATESQAVWLYRNVHECPICFLVYPRLNGTRCCGQEICTECFVQIRRNPPHPPYNSNDEATDVLDLLSEPAACPYCAQSDLGIIFEAPPFEWGMQSSTARPVTALNSSSETSSRSSSHENSVIDIPKATASRKRRTSVPASHDSVITIDMIRPDWEEKLASARRRLARKSAAARALHQAALLPTECDGDRNGTSHSRSTTHSRSQQLQTSDAALNGIVQATQSMSIEQTRALEQKMLDDAIKASLSQR